MTFFLEKGADINHGNADGWTPLMYAIQGKNLENVKLLLERGADVKKADKDGKRLPEPLKIARTPSSFEIRFRKKKKKTSIRDRAGTTSMFKGKSEVGQLVLFVL